MLEYAEDQEAAEQYRFEDGDLFFMEDLNEDAMFAAMLKEIFGEGQTGEEADLLKLFGHMVSVIDNEYHSCFGEILEYTDAEDGEPEERIGIELSKDHIRAFYKSEILFLVDHGPA